MGNENNRIEENQFQNTPSFIQITLKKNYYFPGETITGTITLKSDKQLSLAKFSYLILQTEYWNYKYRNKNTTKSDQHKVIETSITYPTLLKMSLREGIIIPFEIKLPEFMVSSFEYSLPDKQAFIRSELIITIEEINAFASTFLIIQKPLSINNNPLIYEEISEPKILGFVNQGSVKIKCSYPSNTYCFLSHIPLNFEINASTSKIDISKLVIKFNREIKFLDHIKEDKDLIWEEQLYYAEYPLQNVNQSFTVDIIAEEPEELFNRYMISDKSLNIADKKQLINFMPSLTSPMISCEYKIIAEVQYKLLIPLLQNPTLIIPVTLCHENDISWSKFQ